jgi:hypothetical protein
MTYPDIKRRNVNMHTMLLDKATDIVEEVRRTIVLERLEVSAGGPSRSPNSLLVPGYRLFLTPTQWALLVFCNRYAGAPFLRTCRFGLWLGSWVYAKLKILSIANRIIAYEIESNRSEESQSCTNFNAVYSV